MYNVKSLLKEELILNEKRKLLNENSLKLIKDPNHIKHVLGIHVGLNENHSLSIRKQIIEAQLSLQNVLSSANKFLGQQMEKGKEKALEVVSGVRNFKDIVTLFKDLVLSPEYMEVAVNSLRDSINQLNNTVKGKTNTIISKVGDYPNFTEPFKRIMDQVADVLIKQSASVGWKGFLYMLGFGTIVSSLDKKVLDFLIEKGIDVVMQFNGLLGGITGILNSFKDFKTTIIEKLDITPILNWFTNIIGESTLKQIFIGVNIVNIMGELLQPVIQKIDWSKANPQTP